MKSCAASDTDHLRRPLLVPPANEQESSTHISPPPGESIEKQRQLREDVSPTVVRNADSKLLYEELRQPSHPHQRRQALSGNQHNHAQAVPLAHNDTSTTADHFPVSQRQPEVQPHRNKLNSKADGKALSRSRCGGNVSSETYSASSATGFHKQDCVPPKDQGECVGAPQVAEEGNSRPVAICFRPPSIPSFFHGMNRNHSLEESTPASLFTRLSCSCFAKAPRGPRRSPSFCGDCNTIFWWTLSPLFLLFTWFCWHGVRALWKMGTGTPGHWLSPNESSFLHDYGLVIDAGSHGSRLSVYSWKPRLFDPTHPFTGPVSFPKLLLHGLPAAALRTPGDVPSVLSALIDQGTEFLHFHARVPELRWSEFPLYLKATGGLRNMGQAPRDTLMEAIRDYLEDHKRNPFRFERTWARVLAGEEEGVYGWLAVNSVRNSLLDDPARTTGALDLGGASAQITFFPTHTSVLEDLTLVRLGDRTIRLYSHSYLGYGWGDALSRINAGVAIEALLHRPKTGDRFIAENVLTAGPCFADVPGGKKATALSAGGAAALPASTESLTSRSEIVDSKLLTVPLKQETRVPVDLSVNRIAAEGIRMRLPAVLLKCADNGLSLPPQKYAKPGDTVGIDYDEVAGGQSVTEKRRKGEEEGSGEASSSSHWTRRYSGEKLVLTPPRDLSLAHSADVRPGRDITHNFAFRFSDEHVKRSRLHKDAPPDDFAKEQHTHYTLLPVAPESLDRGRRLHAGGEQTPGKIFAEKKNTSGEQPRRGQQTSGEAIICQASSADTAADGKPVPQGQHERAAVSLGRHGAAAAPAAGSHADNKEPSSHSHPSRKRDATSGRSGARKSGKKQQEEVERGNEEVKKRGVEGAVEAAEEIEIVERGKAKVADAVAETEKETLTAEQVDAKATHGSLTINVHHPCYPRGSIQDFSMPPLSYPERRYYVDISVDKIAEYMHIAGYNERDIESTIGTMDPHALERRTLTEKGRYNRANLPPKPQEQQWQQQQPLKHQQEQFQQRRGERSFGKEREASALLKLLPATLSPQAEGNAQVSALGEQENQSLPELRQLSPPKRNALTVGDRDCLHTANSSMLSNGMGEENNSFPLTRLHTHKSKVAKRDLLRLGTQSLVEEKQLTEEDADKFPASTSRAATLAAPGCGTHRRAVKACDPRAMIDAASTRVIHRRTVEESESVARRKNPSYSTAGAQSSLSHKIFLAQRSGDTVELTSVTNSSHRSEEQRDGLEDAEKEGKPESNRRSCTSTVQPQVSVAQEEGFEHVAADPMAAEVRPKIKVVARFIGTGDFEACQARATNFLAFGQYSKVHAAMHLPSDAPLSAFLEGAKRICAQRVGQLQLKRRMDGSSRLLYSKKSLQKLCWKSIWSYAVLRQGFGFSPSSTRISFAPVAGSGAAGPAPEWAAGSMIAEVNSYPWEVPPETYEAPFHLATAFLIMSVTLALILYHEVHWMRKRLKETRASEEGYGEAWLADGLSENNWQEWEMQQVGHA